MKKNKKYTLFLVTALLCSRQVIFAESWTTKCSRWWQETKDYCSSKLEYIETISLVAKCSKSPKNIASLKSNIENFKKMFKKKPTFTSNLSDILPKYTFFNNPSESLRKFFNFSKNNKNN